MPITEQQRQKRKDFLGSSDVPRLLAGERHALWLEKTGRAERADISGEGPVMAGNFFEDGVLRWAETQIGRIHIMGSPEFIDQAARLISHPDGIHDVSGWPVEAKTTGLGPIQVPERWGRNGQDLTRWNGRGEAAALVPVFLEDPIENPLDYRIANEVPRRVQLQCHVHMICTATPFSYVPAFLGDGRWFCLFGVERNEGVVDSILTAAADFWGWVDRDEEPPAEQDQTLDLDGLKRLPRVNGKTALVEDATLARHLEAKAVLKAAKDASEQAQAALIQELGPCEDGAAECGRAVTFRADKRGRRTLRIGKAGR